MVNFREIITNFSIGAITKSKLGFYAKRLAKETATRRLASVLMIGLLLLQFATILAPPKPSYASSAGDLVAGGPFTKQSLITTVWDRNPAGVQQVFNRLQITRSKMQESTIAQACKGQGWLSMGRNPDAGSTQWQPGIYIGPAESRWAQNCFNVMRGTSKIQDTQTGQWYEWGVILECGNIILKPTTPPPTQPNVVINCKKLTSDIATPIAIGTQVLFKGKAEVSRGNVGPDKTVTMSYAVYDEGAPLSNPKSSIKKSTGIPDDPDGSGKFLDPTGQKFTFNEAGTYEVRLGVAYRVAGAADEVIAPGSWQGECVMRFVVNEPKTLQCGSLTLANSSGQAPFVPKLTGKAIKEGTGPGPGLRPSKYVYTQYKQDPNGTETYLSKKYTPTGKVITRNNTQTETGLQEFQDPAPPATSFDATDFRTTENGEYLIILNVYDQDNQQVPTKFRCKQPYTVTSTPQVKTFSCVNLSANPSQGTATPFTTTLNATASVSNTTIKEYQFDFGDGGKQTVQSSALTQSLQHTYNSTGNFTAKVKVVSNDSDATSTKDTCETTISVNTTPPTKTFSCVNLIANPSQGTATPFTTTLNATASVSNTTIKEYQFDFGDGGKQTVQSSALTQSLQHTYNSTGNFTAKVKVVSNDSDATSTKDTCEITISVNTTPPPSEDISSKVVSNLTLLTTDGKPTDANGQTARAGDKLKYEIGLAHFGEAPISGYIFKDDISDILDYADVIDLGGGSVQQIEGRSVIIWPAVDIPVSSDRNNPSFVAKSFTVQIKDPIPTNAQKPTDKTNFDCKVDDEFNGKLVSTPLFINPAKQVECLAASVPVLATLPSTGAGVIPIIIIGLFAAASVYLFFRNRLLKRELELVEVLNDGVQTNG